MGKTRKNLFSQYKRFFVTENGLVPANKIELQVDEYDFIEYLITLMNKGLITKRYFGLRTSEIKIQNKLYFKVQRLVGNVIITNHNSEIVFNGEYEKAQKFLELFIEGYYLAKHLEASNL